MRFDSSAFYLLLQRKRVAAAKKWCYEQQHEWRPNCKKSENRRGRIICTQYKLLAKAFTIKVKSAKVFIQRVYNERETEKNTKNLKKKNT